MLLGILKANLHCLLHYYAGTEALFADLCHFPVLAVQVFIIHSHNYDQYLKLCVLRLCVFCLQIAFTLIVFPCLLLAYTGQAAYIVSNKGHVFDAFYRSIPGLFRLLQHRVL